MYTFGVVDYVILALCLTISTFIGIYYKFSGGKQKSTKVSVLTISTIE